MDTAAHEINTSEQEPSEAHFFARQPILDRKRQLLGHEFLFRPGAENYFVDFTPEAAHQATLQMVDNSILYDFGWLTGGKAFLNSTRRFLTGKLAAMLPGKSTVLELPDDIEPDDEVVEGCRRVRIAGHQIALSNFQPRAGMDRLLPLADYVKIDFRRSDAAMRREALRSIGASESSCQLIAEKVETEQEFRLASQERFHFFQGFFFCEPAMSSRDQLPTNALNHINLLGAVNKPIFDWWEIDRLVRNDPALLYSLLRVVNSAAFATSAEISSVRTALLILGQNEFRRLALQAIATDLCSSKPSELLVLALQRAYFCELAAYQLHQDPSEQYMFGLISLFPALLSSSVRHVVNLLPVSAQVKAAMLGESNGVATALHTLRHYELGSDSPWDDPYPALQHDDVGRWYQESLVRARQAAQPNQATRVN